MVNDIQWPKRPDLNVGKIPPDELPEVPFVPPQEIAQTDIAQQHTQGQEPMPAAKTTNTNPKPKRDLMAPLKKLNNWWKTRTKKQKIIIGVIAAVLLALLLAGGYWFIKSRRPAPKPVIVQKEEVKPPPKPTTERSRLTGLPVSPETNLLPVTGVIIENSPDARPQAGLYQAGIVFEAIAEGGITRFLTLFQESQPDFLGPVRSVRPYFLQWLQGFDAAIAHAGGSPAALAKIRAEGIKDLDQFANGGPYRRVNTRYAPHNLYTNVGDLIALGRSKGYNSSTFTSLLRKDDKPAAAVTARVIDLNISSALYNVHYDYDAPTNSYKRSQAGRPHTDEKNGLQLNPKVVIALVMAKGIDSDGQHTVYATTGGGPAYFFQDGEVIVGTWAKGADKEQFKFLDSAGAAIALNAGQTWISIVSEAPSVIYAP